MKLKPKRRWWWWSPMFAQWFRGKPKFNVIDGLRLSIHKPRLPPSYYYDPVVCKRLGLPPREGVK